ncbi:MAG: hypothetical protein UT48_C0025G0009 [Parcubacteria group bacterium GW2011_GWE2_39_37]|uniref:Uncharacterized protein n=1 Tax=Candidatus Falkowbacteria bacterium GW2011_GWF2_39_8 TaxID=1618642 RepID=A0A0G0Q1A7_9BACT|nr:MAG: hypothetical protein UT48_C0025G0009 [Parcubacteria group bacterium GW2011_GWE2_39_37]KKR31111.1 MAG: hypothetical protein UT64_C0073G0004 [Candidatus Falkowbacteria bacterium GW2011_GWF2_39_8]
MVEFPKCEKFYRRKALNEQLLEQGTYAYGTCLPSACEECTVVPCRAPSQQDESIKE